MTPESALGARTGLLALTASLACALLIGAPAAIADVTEKQGSHKAEAQQSIAQGKRAPGERVKGKHREPVEAVQCGDVLSKAGKCSLNSDLVCSAPISITGSNVHLDLAGHSISCNEANWARWSTLWRASLSFLKPSNPLVNTPPALAFDFLTATLRISWSIRLGACRDLPESNSSASPPDGSLNRIAAKRLQSTTIGGSLL